MKLIKDKKLFGLINFVDIIIIAIIAVGGFFAYKLVFKGDSSKFNIGGTYETTTYTIRIENLPLGVEKYITAGTSVYDNETNVYVGKVIAFESGDYTATRESKDLEEIVKVSVPNRETVYLTIEVDVSDQGADLITANNYYIKVGKLMGIRTGRFAGEGYVTSIKRLDDK